MKTRTPGFDRAVENFGSQNKMALALGITRQAIVFWGGRIPMSHVFTIEKMTRIPRETLRPDVFAVPRPRGV
jgi:DNA-binding transcriptional regulator YdaS (Cro superfamily)